MASPQGIQTIGRGLVLAVLIGLLYGIRWFAEELFPGLEPLDGATVALGFLFLAAFIAGRFAVGLRLPKITGYLLVGLLVGPEVLGLLTEETLVDLDLLNRLAIGVIAFIAGAELRPAMLRERGRTILIMLVFEVALVLLLVTAFLLLLAEYVPFLAGEPMLIAIVLAVVFASVATINSPAVTIALLDDQKARGPVSSTTLGIVVAADVVVVVMVTLTLSLARGMTAEGGGGLDPAFLLTLGWELVGAILAGALLGLLVDLYLRYVGAYLPIFTVFLVLIGFEIAQALHLEFMLFMLSAGFFVENISPVDGEPLVHAVERVAVPAYALFFALAGASIHLAEIAQLWPLAVGVVLVRAAGLWIGCGVGARVAGAEDSVRRYTWMGLVSQAGVALGLVTVAERALPEAGAAMRTLFLAMIALHELVGPVLFRYALSRAGEIPETEEGLEPEPAPAPASR